MYITCPINCFSGMCAWCICHPMEVVKNAITTNYAPTHAKPASELHFGWSKTAVMAQHLINEGGVARLFTGFGIGQSRQVVYTTSRLSLYDPVEQVFTMGGTRQPTVVDRMLAGGTAGALAGLFSSPVEVALVRMSKKESKGMTLGTMMSSIYADSGVAGYYRGVGPLMQRTFVVGVAQVGFYKQMMAATTALSQAGILPISDPKSLVMLSSTITGFFYAGVTMPLEFARVRMSAQAGKSGSNLKYKNSMQTVALVYKEEGIRVIYGVFTPYCGRCVTHTVISFNIIHVLQNSYKNYVLSK
jgi:solute carrier family 25 oxoglutarate transporter 11